RWLSSNALQLKAPAPSAAASVGLLDDGDAAVRGRDWTGLAAIVGRLEEAAAHPSDVTRTVLPVDAMVRALRLRSALSDARGHGQYAMFDLEAALSRSLAASAGDASAPQPQALAAELSGLFARHGQLALAAAALSLVQHHSRDTE